MSLCDSEMKQQVESSPEFNDIEETLGSMGLLPLIKKLVYTGGANNKQVRNYKAMSIMKLMMLYQEKFQDIQEFRDQYLAIQKVFNELNIRFGRCKEDTKAILAKQGINKPTTAQLKNVMDKVENYLKLFSCTRQTNQDMAESSKKKRMMYWKAKTHPQRGLLTCAG